MTKQEEIQIQIRAEAIALFKKLEEYQHVPQVCMLSFNTTDHIKIINNPTHVSWEEEVADNIFRSLLEEGLFRYRNSISNIAEGLYLPNDYRLRK